MPEFDPQPVVLAGRHVRLEPLCLEHADGLHSAHAPEIWEFLSCPPPKSTAEMRDWIAGALAKAAEGVELPFALCAPGDGCLIGSTRYLDIQRPHRGLEIGWTWIGPAWQRSSINTEAKLLLLTHAFETLGAIRVQLKTDARNTRSQRAIVRLGATYEGTLRRHRILCDGVIRDTVMYSIIADEWPRIKARLEKLLAASEASGPA